MTQDIVRYLFKHSGGHLNFAFINQQIHHSILTIARNLQSDPLISTICYTLYMLGIQRTLRQKGRKSKRFPGNDLPPSRLFTR
jgi:hypothetical protein